MLYLLSVYLYIIYYILYIYLYHVYMDIIIILLVHYSFNILPAMCVWV